MAEPLEWQEAPVPQGQPFDPASPTLHWSGDSTEQRDVAAADMLPVRRQIGRFQLIQVVGLGGFGTVYRAADTQLDRTVALKVPRAGSLISEPEVERFLREGRAAAQLRHPHIVPVYEAGRDGNEYYIASAFVDGESLRHRIRRGEKFSSRDAAGLVCKLAAALQFAHNKGIIHRDVKPENIMLTREGEPQIMDFGLARRETGEEDGLQTQEGTRMGTPAYMSPEQAEGKSHLADARSDVWSLGVVLYELLTGTRPFEGNVDEILRAIVGAEPRPLRRVNRHVPRDLETICLKCLAKHPEQRYPSAQHLADDLERWLTHQPILARRTGLLLRMAKWTRRNPLAASVLGSLMLTASAALVYQQTRPGYLDLHVSPADAHVTFDGAAVALQEGRALIVHPPGRFDLEITAPDHLPHQQQVTLVRGREDATLVSVDLRSIFGHFEIDTEPSGASVSIMNTNGDVLAAGTTPFRSSALESGTYTLALQKDMYLPLEVQVEVPDGLRTALVPIQPLELAVEGARSFKTLSDLMQVMGTKPEPGVEISVTQSMPLSELVNVISESFGMPVIPMTPYLEEAGIVLDAPLGGNAREMVLQAPSLRQINDFILHPLEVSLKPELVPQDGVPTLTLLLTSRERAESEVLTVLHPVGDLVHGPWAVNGEMLAQRIVYEVDMPSWSQYGGFGFIEYLPIAYSLSVRQTWQNHSWINSALEDIRQARAANQERFQSAVADPIHESSRSQPLEAVTALALEPVVPAMGAIVMGANPWEFPLHDRPAEELHAEPAYGEDAPSYGALTLGGGADTTVVFSLDPSSGRLFVDRNNDERLEIDEATELSDGVNGYRYAILNVEIEYPQGRLPYRLRIVLSEETPDQFVCQSDTARGGEIAIDDGTYLIALIDSNCDARFDDLQNGLLLIDLDGDGTFDEAADSTERHNLGDRIEVNGTTIAVDTVSQDGLSMTIERLEN